MRTYGFYFYFRYEAEYGYLTCKVVWYGKLVKRVIFNVEGTV